MVGMAIMALESKFEARATYRMAARVAHWRPACEVQRKSKQCRANRIRSPVTASAADHPSAGTCRGADGCSNRRESAQAQWEIGALRAHTVAQLKVLCAQHGLRKTGTKAYRACGAAVRRAVRGRAGGEAAEDSRVPWRCGLYCQPLFRPPSPPGRPDCHRRAHTGRDGACLRLHMPGVQAASEALAGTGRTRLRLAPGRCCRLVQAAGGDGVPDVREFKVSCAAVAPPSAATTAAAASTQGVL
jgi:hypothetical protein